MPSPVRCRDLRNVVYTDKKELAKRLLTMQCRKTTPTATTHVCNISRFFPLAFNSTIVWVRHQHFISNFYLFRRTQPRHGLITSIIKRKQFIHKLGQSNIIRVTHYNLIIQASLPTFNVLAQNIRNNSVTSIIQELPDMVLCTPIMLNSATKSQVHLKNVKRTVAEDLKEASIMDKI